MARFLSMQMTSGLPNDAVFDDDDDGADLGEFDNEDMHHFRAAGAFASTYDHNLDMDSDEENEDDGNPVRRYDRRCARRPAAVRGDPPRPLPPCSHGRRPARTRTHVYHTCAGCGGPLHPARRLGVHRLCRTDRVCQLCQL